MGLLSKLARPAGVKVIDESADAPNVGVSQKASCAPVELSFASPVPIVWSEKDVEVFNASASKKKGFLSWTPSFSLRGPKKAKDANKSMQDEATITTADDDTCGAELQWQFKPSVGTWLIVLPRKEEPGDNVDDSGVQTCSDEACLKDEGDESKPIEEEADLPPLYGPEEADSTVVRKRGMTWSPFSMFASKAAKQSDDSVADKLDTASETKPADATAPAADASLPEAQVPDSSKEQDVEAVVLPSKEEEAVVVGNAIDAGVQPSSDEACLKDVGDTPQTAEEDTDLPPMYGPEEADSAIAQKRGMTWSPFSMFAGKAGKHSDAVTSDQPDAESKIESENATAPALVAALPEAQVPDSAQKQDDGALVAETTNPDSAAACVGSTGGTDDENMQPSTKITTVAAIELPDVVEKKKSKSTWSPLSVFSPKQTPKVIETNLVQVQTSPKSQGNSADAQCTDAVQGSQKVKEDEAPIEAGVDLDGKQPPEETAAKAETAQNIPEAHPDATNTSTVADAEKKARFAWSPMKLYGNKKTTRAKNSGDDVSSEEHSSRDALLPTTNADDNKADVTDAKAEVVLQTAVAGILKSSAVVSAGASANQTTQNRGMYGWSPFKARKPKQAETDSTITVVDDSTTDGKPIPGEDSKAASTKAVAFAEKA